jgi:hypothetical protein
LKYRPKPHQHPGWTIKGVANFDVPNELTRWEKFLLAEQISDKELWNNPKVMKFIVKYARTYFVPTKVLQMYGMDWDE